MTVELWVDANGPVDGAAMVANGITGAIRYLVAGSAGKLITRAEYADLIAHGRQVRFVVERLTTDADGGYNAGVAIAGQVPAALAAIGAPAGSWVYAANDKPGWSQADVDYVRGFRDVLGLGSTGAYGFGAFLAACHQQGVAGSLWQAGPAPSRTSTSAIANFWQRQGGPGAASDGPVSPTTITLAGRVCDLNNRLNQEANVTTLDDTYQPKDGAGNNVGSPVSYAWMISQIYDGLFNHVGAGPAVATQVAAAATKADVDEFETNTAKTLADVLNVVDAIPATQPVELSGTATVTIPLAPAAAAAPAS